MEPFVTHVGRAVPLRRSNVDTDQIIQAEYLKQVSRTDFGIQAVIAPRFGDIFRGNSTKAGLLPVVLPEATVAALQDAVDADPATEVVVDLDNRVVLAEAAGIKASFEIDDYTRWRLMEGLDDIGLTLRHVDDITAFEHSRPAFLPVTA